MSKRFVYGTNPSVPDYMFVPSTGHTFKFVTDHLGSPVEIIDVNTGAVAEEIHYDDFGNVTSDSNPGFQPFRFAGCLYDIETKLCQFGARPYDASTGRWLSKDPDLFRAGGFDPNQHVRQLQNPRTFRYASNRKMELNLYGYTFNDPVNFIDAEGKYAVPVLIGVCAAGYVLVKFNKSNREDRQNACKAKATTSDDTYACEKIGGFLEDPFYSPPGDSND